MPYAMLIVPFFHSLQYLPFAFRRIESDLSRRPKRNLGLTMTLNILGILEVGFLLFDLIPIWLDERTGAKTEKLKLVARSL